jgi:hypothetical protein
MVWRTGKMPKGVYVRTEEYRRLLKEGIARAGKSKKQIESARKVLAEISKRPEVRKSYSHPGRENPFYGKQHPPELMARIGSNCKAYWATHPEARRKMSRVMRRRWRDDPKVRASVIKSRTGAVMSEKARRKISEAGLGRSKGRMLETNIERRVVNWARDNGILVFKADAKYGVGAPDRIFILSHGRIVFIEFKKPGKKPKKIQVFVHNKLRRLDHAVFVVDNAEIGIQILKEAV